MDSLKEKFYKIEKNVQQSTISFEQLTIEVGTLFDDDIKFMEEIKIISKSMNAQLIEISDLDMDVNSFKQKIMATKTIYRRECELKKEENEKMQLNKENLIEKMRGVLVTLDTTINVQEAEENALKDVKQSREEYKNVQTKMSQTSKYLWGLGGACKIVSIFFPFVGVVESLVTVAQVVDTSTAFSALIKPSREKVEILEENIAENTILIEEMKKSIQEMEDQIISNNLSISTTESSINKLIEEIKELEELQQRSKTWIPQLTESLQFLIEMEPKAQRICRNHDSSEKVLQRSIKDFKESLRNNEISITHSLT